MSRSLLITGRSYSRMLCPTISVYFSHCSLKSSNGAVNVCSLPVSMSLTTMTQMHVGRSPSVSMSRITLSYFPPLIPPCTDMITCLERVVNGHFVSFQRVVD